MKIIVHETQKRNKRHFFIEKIVQMIEGHDINRGQRLPSIRLFAKENRLSFGTVVKIYDQLEKMGYVEKRQGQGTYVSQKGFTGNIPLQKKLLKPVFNRTRFSNHLLLENKAYRFPFVDTHQSRYMVPYDFIAQLNEDIDRKLLSDYAEPYGDKVLVGHLIHLFKKEGMAVSQKQVLITNGVQQGINLIARTFIAPGDKVMIAEITFPAAADVFNWQGAELLPIPLEPDGMAIDYIEHICRAHHPKMIYIMPNFNNPTGISMSESKKARLLQLADIYDFYIIEDDSWGDLYMSVSKPVSLKAMDQINRVIYLRGFTKTLGAGYRIGAIVAEESILESLAVAKLMSDLGSPAVTQKMVASLLDSDYYGRFLNTLRCDLKERMQCVWSIFDSHLPQGVTYIRSTGGPNVWITLPNGVDTSLFLAYARCVDVNFSVGALFYAGQIKQNQIRLSIVNIEKQLLEEGLLLFCSALKEWMQGLTTLV